MKPPRVVPLLLVLETNPVTEAPTTKENAIKLPRVVFILLMLETNLATETSTEENTINLPHRVDKT